MPCSSTNPADFHQKSFRIKHDDDKFLTKLLSKESSKSNPSFRVYYGNVPSAVPFTWETRPGTPKHTFADNSSVPPLTPPPSYFSAGSKSYSSKQTRANFLHTFLRRINSKKLVSSSTLSWSSSSSSSFSDPSVTPPHRRMRRRFSSWGSSFDEKAAMGGEVCGSYRMCFGIGSKSCSSTSIEEKMTVRIRRPSNWQVKNALLSIVGR